MKDPLSDLVLLGDPRLYEVCRAVKSAERQEVPGWIERLKSVMAAIRRKYGFGRGIAGPQVGIMKRIFYIELNESATVVINPVIIEQSKEMFELWDDCMSFPNLLVRVKRHQHIHIQYRDENWIQRTWKTSGATAELLQHEYDHLDGILCTMRAIDDRSFKWRGQPSG